MVFKNLFILPMASRQWHIIIIASAYTYMITVYHADHDAVYIQLLQAIVMNSTTNYNSK